MLDSTTMHDRKEARREPFSLADETNLISRLQAGEAAAQEQFVRYYSGQMLAVATRYCRCEQDAADAVQDAFISAFKAVHNFSGQSRLSTWLHRITVNACLMRLRAERSRPSTSIEDLLPQFDRTGHHARPVRNWRNDAFEELASAELRAQVRSCIDQLPDSYRTILLLRDIEQYDTEETAQMLGESVANVKTRLHRARQALRTLLESLMV
jgi:RNA polymerase sigma-70 factor (ECF subfamily)